MSASALLELAADSNRLLGTSHNLTALRTSHSAKLAQLHAQQQQRQQQETQQRLQAAERRATTQLLRNAGLHAEVAYDPQPIERRGNWTAAEREGLSHSLEQHRPPTVHHSRKRRSSTADVDVEDEADDASPSSSSLPFDDCAQMARRMRRRVTEVVSLAYPSASSTLPLPFPSEPCTLTSEQSEAFARHIAQQFERAWRPPPTALHPPPLPMEQSRRQGTHWVGGVGRAMWRAVVGTDSEAEDEDEEEADEDWAGDEEEGEDEGHSSEDDEGRAETVKKAKHEEEEDEEFDGGGDSPITLSSGPDQSDSGFSDDSGEVALSVRLRQQKSGSQQRQ